MRRAATVRAVSPNGAIEVSLAPRCEPCNADCGRRCGRWLRGSQGDNLVVSGAALERVPKVGETVWLELAVGAGAIALRGPATMVFALLLGACAGWMSAPWLGLAPDPAVALGAGAGFLFSLPLVVVLTARSPLDVRINFATPGDRR
jgi:hypothetical protein